MATLKVANASLTTFCVVCGWNSRSANIANYRVITEEYIPIGNYDPKVWTHLVINLCTNLNFAEDDSFKITY